MVSFRVILTNSPLSKLLSDENLSQKAYLNALAGALEYGAQFIVGFVITPLLLAGLGDYLFGAWQILRRLTGYISVASGRATQALKWTIAYRQTSSDYEQNRRHVGSALAVWLLFSPLVVAFGGLLVWFAPSLLKAPMEFSWSVRVTAALLVASLIVINLAGVPQSVLRGENLGYKRMGLSAILVFVGGGLTAIALHFNTGLVGIAAAYLATTLASGAVFLRVVRSFVPWFGAAIPSFAEIRGFIGLSGWFLAWRFVSISLQTADTVELGILTSVEMVTTYSLTRYASEAFVQLIGLAVFGVLPGLAGIIGSGNLQRAARVRNEIMLITWVIAAPIGITILIWNRAFLQIWVGAKYYVGPIPTLLIVLMAFQYVLIRNDGSIINLTLDLRRKVLIGVVSTTISMVLAGILVSSFNLGITGLVLGFIAGRCILSLAYPWLVGRFLGISLLSQLKNVLRPVAITLLLLVLALGVGRDLTVSTWISLIVSVGATTAVVLLLAFYAGLSGDQRRHILHRVRLVTAQVFVC